MPVGQSHTLKCTKTYSDISIEARGFTKSGQGNPDESRAARYILKDYVNGKLLFCHPPPDINDDQEFNAEIYSNDGARPRRAAQQPAHDTEGHVQGPSVKGLDRDFFIDRDTGFAIRNAHQQVRPGEFVGRNTAYPHQRMVDDTGHVVITEGSGQGNGDGLGMYPTKPSKKHFKGKR